MFLLSIKPNGQICFAAHRFVQPLCHILCMNRQIEGFNRETRVDRGPRNARSVDFAVVALLYSSPISVCSQKTIFMKNN